MNGWNFDGKLVGKYTNPMDPIGHTYPGSLMGWDLFFRSNPMRVKMLPEKRGGSGETGTSLGFFRGTLGDSLENDREDDRDRPSKIP